MRLATRLFLTSALVIAVLAFVGVLGLHAVGRLVEVNREIATQTLPAVRLTGSLRDAIVALPTLEVRYLVLRDPRYATLWAERTLRVRDELGRLRALLATPLELNRAEEAQRAFDAYREVVAEERTLLGEGQRGRALALAEGPAREAIERVETSLAGLAGVIDVRVLEARAEAARLEARVWTGVLLAVLSAVGLSLLATGLLAARLTRSLRALTDATEAVAAGSFREPIAATGSDEIGRLARSFNAMADALRRMEEHKEEFFASVSHELRSPLTSVREATHLLREGVPGPLNPKQSRLVEIIGASTDRLLGLVNQILELSRLRAGALPFERVPVDVESLVARALEEVRPRAEEAGVTLDAERTGRDFTAVGDPERLLHVVVNLLANGLRFTPRGGRVVVRLVDAGPELELSVEDTGVGIPAEALPHVFDAYRQAHKDRGGTGLGLAIVRSVVQAHGGRVTVESREGKGSRFTVLLPRGAPA